MRLLSKCWKESQTFYNKSDKPRSLREMFAVSDLQILKYVDDYRLHLIVTNEITDFDGFRTSLREVLEIIRASDDRKKMKEVLERNPRFKSQENEAVSAINVFIGLKVLVNKKKEDRYSSHTVVLPILSWR